MKCEDLSLSLQNSHKTWMPTWLCNYCPPINRWEVETGESPEYHGLVSLTYAAVNKRFSFDFSAVKTTYFLGRKPCFNSTHIRQFTNACLQYRKSDCFLFTQRHQYA